MTLNQKTVTAELKRRDICDLKLACTIIQQSTGVDKWGELHDKLQAILDDFDSKQEI